MVWVQTCRTFIVCNSLKAMRLQSGRLVLKRRKSPKLTGKCGVCGDKASNHFQYGAKNAQVCFACRSFFRRLARNKIVPNRRNCSRIKDQALTDIGQCHIDVKTRKSCVYCRYIKCCDLGMKTEFVMTKEEVKDHAEKAAIVKESGINSKFLPDTKYELRVK